MNSQHRLFLAIVALLAVVASCTGFLAPTQQTLPHTAHSKQHQHQHLVHQSNLQSSWNKLKDHIRNRGQKKSEESPRRVAPLNALKNVRQQEHLLLRNDSNSNNILSSWNKLRNRGQTTSTSLQAAATNMALAAPSKSDVQALASATAFVAMDVLFRRLFSYLQISFPSSLGACSLLFGALLVLPERIAETLFERLQPGATLLAKWLPVFFVPSLVTLPLADTSQVEVVKVAAVVVGGFFFTLLTTAFSVQWVRKLQKGSDETATTTQAVTGAVEEVDKQVRDKVAAAASPQKRFSDELFNCLCLLTISSGLTSFLSRTSLPPARALFFLSTTLTSFVFGARLPAQFTQLVHPLVTCTALTWTVLAGCAAVTRQSFVSMLGSYTRGGLKGLTKTGAGDILLFLRGPAVVSLAISMYERRRLMRENLLQVGTGITVSTFGGLFGTALAVRTLNLASPYLRLSLLSRNITSPLAMAIAGILGADVSLAVSMVVVTGLIGANFGAAILDAVGIKDAVARGLGIGAAAHGLGTAAFANEKDAFPFAAIAMALTATAATVTVSIPIFRQSLVQLALGV